MLVSALERRPTTMQLVRYLLPAIPLALSATAQAASVEIVDAQGVARTITREQIDALAQRTVAANDHGTDTTFSGADLRDVLHASGIGTNELRGPALRQILLIEAADGYRITMSLTELAPTLGNGSMLLATSENGRSLPEASGPFRLVIPSDKRAARWVRQVSRLVIRQVE